MKKVVCINEDWYVMNYSNDLLPPHPKKNEICEVYNIFQWHEYTMYSIVGYSEQNGAGFISTYFTDIQEQQMQDEITAALAAPVPVKHFEPVEA